MNGFERSTGLKEDHVNNNPHMFQRYFRWLSHEQRKIATASESPRENSGFKFYETKPDVVWNAYGSRTAGENDDVEYWDNGSGFDEYTHQDDYYTDMVVHDELHKAGEVKIDRNFILNEFKRRGFDEILGDDMEDMIDISIAKAIIGIDSINPYTLYEGLSDVVFTQENRYFQYRSLEASPNGVQSLDLMPETLETFRFEPGLARNNWQIQYNTGKLDGLLEPIGETLSEIMSKEVSYSKEYREEQELRGLNGDAPEHWMLLEEEYGEIFWGVLEIGVWATILWICHPEDKQARDWREFHSTVFFAVYNGMKHTHKINGMKIHHTEVGTALFQGWDVYEPNEFERIPRQPLSCYYCGIVEHCVALNNINGNDTRYLCEGCRTGEEAFAGVTCGTRNCDHSECFHHPAKGMTKEQKEMFKLKFRQNLARALEDRRFGEFQSVRGPDGRMQIGRKYDGFISLNMAKIEHNVSSLAELMDRDLMLALKE